MRTAVDFSKDQTYFLWGLTQAQLARTMFPLGEMTKTEVRALAEEFDLPVAKKHESYEICFVPNGDYAGFMDAYLREKGVSREATSPGRRSIPRRRRSGPPRGRASFHSRTAERSGDRRSRTAVCDCHRSADADGHGGTERRSASVHADRARSELGFVAGIGGARAGAWCGFATGTLPAPATLYPLPDGRGGDSIR